MRRLKRTHPNAGIEELRPLVLAWWKRQKDRGEFAQAWGAALRAWPRIKWKEGESPNDEAIRVAAALTIRPNIQERYGGPLVGRVLNVCAALREFSHGGEFFLSTHHAGRVLGCKSMVAWRVLDVLCAEGVLERTKVGNEVKASRYRFCRGVDVDSLTTDRWADET